MNVLSLFSGIGAMDLGLSRAGFTTVAFCEIDPFCRRVLARHWPGVPCFDDVRSLTADALRAARISVDVIAGGWPCQPHSIAGARGASSDEREMWPEFFRLVREVRPRWVIGENVPGLLSSESGRFFGGILRDLASIGYSCEWRTISAADVGAPHLRERVWIVAYPDSNDAEWGRGIADAGDGCEGGETRRGQSDRGYSVPHVADAIGAGLEGGAGLAGHAAAELAPAQRGGAVPDAAGPRQPQPFGAGRPILDREALEPAGPQCGGRDHRLAQSILGRVAVRPPCGMDGPWSPGWEDGTPRVARGVPDRVARLRALGNALVPQVPELIGRAILAAEAEERAA